MDGLPGNPSDQSGNNGSSNNTVPASLIGGPPPFGSSFNPQPNPAAPNNPYPTQPTPLQYNPSPQTPNIPENPDPLKHEHYSEVAQHKQRDEHGHFIHTDTPTSYTPAPQGQAPFNPSVPSTPPNSSSVLPPIIEINQNTEASSKKDLPLFGFFITIQ